MKKITVALIALTLFFGLTACNHKLLLPTENGIWYCAELQAQFTVGYRTDEVSDGEDYYVDEMYDYVIVNGDRIAALLRNNHGSKLVSIICQERNHPVYKMGDIIYIFEFVRLSDTEYVLKDEGGKRYTFVRIDDPITSPTTVPAPTGT